MKRSDMLDIMQPFFSLQGSDRDRASKLLDAMENAGMLPPHKDVIIESSGEGLNAIRDYRKGYRWEPEVVYSSLEEYSKASTIAKKVNEAEKALEEGKISTAEEYLDYIK